MTGLEAAVRVQRGDFELDAELVVAPGEDVAVLGPNGAGKTTLLRALAGLEPFAGRVALDGRVLDDDAAGIHVGPEHRTTGVVFQDGALFPHLSALDNVAFGLRRRGSRRDDARRAAASWLERVRLGDRGHVRASALSGGERQRVALARALAIEPRLLLLDEPLSALDASARASVRRELRRHLASFAGPRVLVTHDPVDAVALADRIVVLEDGRVVQRGTLADLRARPRTRYVADLVGLNLVRGRATKGHIPLGAGTSLSFAGDADGEVLAIIHPRAVALHRRMPEGTPRNVWEGVVESVDDEGDRARVVVVGPVPIVAEITAAAVADLGLAPGVPVWATVKATEITVYPA